MAYKLHYSDYSTTTGPPDPAAWVGPPGPTGPQGIPGPKGEKGAAGIPTDAPVDGTIYGRGGFPVLSWQPVLTSAAGASLPFLPLSGSTPMTGPITLAGNAMQPLQAVPLQQLNSPMQLMARAAVAARQNNPRVNSVMGAPPVISITNAQPSGQTNTWGNTAPKVSVFNFYGGTPTDNGAGYLQFSCVTVNGAMHPFVWRAEVVADAAKVTFLAQSVSSQGHIRLIVNGQYVSLTPIALTTDWWVTLDFTSVGGRAVRTIILEGDGQMAFGSVSVGPTETLSKPAGSVQRMVAVGDSFTAAGGATDGFMGFPHVLADMLGIRDIWNDGVGGTGYLNNGGSQTTFRQRLSDVVSAAPDIILIVGGYNDLGFTAAALQAEVTAYLAAIRAQPVLKTTPIIVSGVNGGSIPLATTQPAETAIAAAVTAANDPLIWFLPNVNNVAGPYMTGTGNTTAPNGSGNCDIYIGSDATHPNDAGHVFLARLLADDISRVVFRTARAERSGFLPLNGGALGGALTLPGNAASALQAVPLQQLTAATAGGPFLPTAGGSVTGTLNVDSQINLGITGAGCNLVLNSYSGFERHILFNTGGSNRWELNVDGTAEGGSNAGSNLGLARFDDSGNYLGTPISINRATGLITLASAGGGNISLNGPCGFNGTAPIFKPTVSGAKGSNAALGSLIAALAAYGLVIDSTTA